MMKQKTTTQTPSTPEGERIAKRLARAGICSRREAERLIDAGRVSVDGKVITSPALNVTSAHKIAVDGKLIASADATRLWRYHKPRGHITSNHDPQGRPTIFDTLPDDMPRTVTVGRLDFNTEGLLLLTNDGELARHLELPANAWTRHYRVRVFGAVDERKLKALKNGITISGIHYGAIDAEVERASNAGGSNKWLSITITEGKNREVRKVMEHLDLQVTRLIRVSFGPFQLGKLAEGACEEVPSRILRDSLGNFFKGK